MNKTSPLQAEQFDFIKTEAELQKMLEEIQSADCIAFDTEFVSEDCYRPDLCLLQIATRDKHYIVDTKEIADVSSFWELLVAGEHNTIVHAGREELRFCLHSTGKVPKHLFDIQIAAGFIGFEYPAALATLISRSLGKSLRKGETRTDWRRRPLSTNQLDYALQDVLFLIQTYEILQKKLIESERLDWFDKEMVLWQDNIVAYESELRWRRISGVSGFSSRNLAVVRELWLWREKEAEKRNRTPKRILRDDLIAELAKRGTSDPNRIQSVRGMERRDLRKHYDELCQCVQKGLELPESELPETFKRKTSPQLNLIGQFLTAAVGSICRDQQLAPSLVGSTNEIRELVSFKLGLSNTEKGERPSLAVGWRGELIGKAIDDLLAGRTALKISEPLSDQPLVITETK